MTNVSPSSTMRIDQATSADIPALAGLLSVLFSQEAEFTPDRDAQAEGLAQIMVVSPACRAKGIGSNLLAEAISFARVHGCKRITLLTDNTNQSAQKLYAPRGFMASSMLAVRLPHLQSIARSRLAGGSRPHEQCSGHPLRLQRLRSQPRGCRAHSRAAAPLFRGAARYRGCFRADRGGDGSSVFAA